MDGKMIRNYFAKFHALSTSQKRVLLALGVADLAIVAVLLGIMLRKPPLTVPEVQTYAPTIESVAVATPLPVTPETVATATLVAAPVPTSTPLPWHAPALPASIAPLWVPQPAPTNAELEQFIAGMSLEDKVGQMLLIGFHGLTLEGSPELPVMIGRYHVGGLVLLEANARDPQQLSGLTTQLQTLARSSGAGIPLFLSLNHEGGIVVRITQGVTEFPGNMAVAATGDPDNAYIAAALAAQELRVLGLNMNLAPVLDINDEPLNPVIGVRSFGADADLVTEYGRLTVQGFQDYGIIAVAKHFPGHGSVATDSHIALPVLDASLDALWAHELKPFAAAIDNHVGGIMTAHILAPQVDTNGLPATFSPVILNDLLRQEMGYDGVIMTDSLGMAGASGGQSQAEAAVLAVKAGADMLVSTTPMSAHIAIWEALIAAVHGGELSESQIDRSVLRILRLKYTYGLFDAAQPVDLSLVGTAAFQATADHMARASVTLVRGSSASFPLAGPRLLVVSPDQLSLTHSSSSFLADALQAHGYAVRELIFNVADQSNREAVVADALALAGDYDQVIFGEWELVKRHINNGDFWQERFTAALYQRNPNLVVIAWHNPAAALFCPPESTVLTAYGNTPAQVKAIAAVLTGEVSPTGTLPFNLISENEAP